MITRVMTNEACPKCKGEMEKAIDTVRMISRYICTSAVCGAQFEINIGKNEGKRVGKCVIEPTGST